MKYLLCMILGVGVLLAGCEGVNIGNLSDQDLERLSEKAVVCNAPYIRFGTSCCLDQNSNGICDKDEGGSGERTIPELSKPEEKEAKVLPETKEASKEGAVCDEPYIRHGTGCCLDQNENRICDSDDSAAELTKVLEEYLAESLKEESKPKQPPEPQRAFVSTANEPSMGSASAKVTLIEFGDFQCPFCGRFFIDTLPRIRSEYIETGKVRHVFMNFPLSFHPEAQPAAGAAECAHEQGSFWEYHDALYQNQARLGPSLYVEIAEDLGLDMEQFNSCVASGKYTQEISGDFNEGSRAGITGTPGFLVNGIPLIGAHPFQNFQQVIEAELS